MFFLANLIKNVDIFKKNINTVYRGTAVITKKQFLHVQKFQKTL